MLKFTQKLKLQVESPELVYGLAKYLSKQGDKNTNKKNLWILDPLK